MKSPRLLWSLRAFSAQPLICLLFQFKAVSLLTVAAAVCFGGDQDSKKFFQVNVRWPREGGPVFASHFATWDAAHYLYLSEVGYHPNAPSCAFYPLWPLLARWTSPLFGGSHLIAGLVLSNIFSLAAWGLFYRLVARRWGKPAANWSLVFLVAFPGALFFQFNYTESQFLLLVVVLWWALEERRYGWAWLAAGLLPLTRGVGVFAVLPIGWYALEPVLPRRVRDGCKGGVASPPSAGGVVAQISQSAVSPTSKSAGQAKLFGAQVGKPAIRQTWKSALLGQVNARLWLLAAPLVGWGVYLALMGYWTGNPFEGFAAQKHWGVHSISNLWNVPKFVVGLFTPTEWHAFTGSVLDRCAFILLAYTLPAIWRLDKSLLVWTYMLGILPAMSGTFTSFTRFASCAFPMFIALGVFLGRREWRWPRYGLLAVFGVLHVVLVWCFVNFRWAG